MSDFNKMIDEQLELQGTTESTHRILEAMLKRDQLEIEYRQQGISESKIAEFHEAATAAISEGLLGSMKDKLKDKFAGSRAGHALGMKSTAEKEKEAKDGKWYNKLLAAIVAAYDKFIAWVKGVWQRIQAFFVKEETFIKKYNDVLIKNKNNEDVKKIEMDKIVEFDSVKLEDYSASVEANHWDELKDACNKYEPVNGKTTVGEYGLIAAMDFFKSGSNKEMDKEIEKKANVAKTSIQAKATDDSDRADSVRKSANAYLRYIQAYNAAKLKQHKAEYSACKKAILGALGVINHIKTETVNFMTEACDVDIDKSFAPIMESSDEISKHFDEAFGFFKKKEEEKKSFGDKAKEVGKSMWAAIVAAFNSLVNWARKVFYTVMNLFNNNKEIIRKYGDLVAKTNSAKFKGIKIVKLKSGVAEGSWTGVVGKAKDKSVEQWDELYEKFSGSIDTEDEDISANGNVAKVIEFLGSKDVSAINKDIKKSIDDANASLNDAKGAKGDPKVYKAYMRAFRASTSRYLKVVKMKLSSYRSAFMKCVAIATKHEAAFVESFNENYCIEVGYELDSLLLEGDVVDEVIDKAVTGDAQGVTDVNLASTEVIPQGASTDPFALDYEDKNCFSQTVETGDEGVAGTVGAELGDTETSVKAGNETPSVTKEAAEFLESLAEIF